ncbi:MAG: UDP-N-acetylmuramoyl-L-alanine--D-glutamate ligase [Dehalococcoidia bacterium]
MSATNGFDPNADLRAKRALVYSLGKEGQDMAAWLVARGARVTMSDTRSEQQLAAAKVHVPAGVERVYTGQPLLDPEGFHLLAVSQSILRHDPALARARQLGVPITSQAKLFLQLCRGLVVGITGSSGKSTTTALVAAMAKAAGIDAVVGGNIGEPLLARLGEIQPTTTVILEISHTQLQYTDRSPQIAAVTNITPNHLDQFSWDQYVGLKRNILAYQSSSDTAILNADDPTSRTLLTGVRGQLVQASTRDRVPGDGAWCEANAVFVRRGLSTALIVKREDLQLRGQHNLANVTMAAAIASVAAIPVPAIQEAAASFTGVAHRLELVGFADGAAWVNDSIATTPERTVAGLLSFEEPVVLLLGGRDKNLPLDKLQDVVRERCRAVVCFGEAGPLYFGALRGTAKQVELTFSLPDAVAIGRRFAKPGDVVLLSPAGTSFDAYPNFEARGEAFRQAVRGLPGFALEVPS